MKLLGTDADLGTKAKFKAIGKTGGGINIDGCCIHFIKESAGMLIILCYNGLRVFSVVFIDMGNGFVKIFHNLCGKYIIEIFPTPVFFGSRYDLTI